MNLKALIEKRNDLIEAMNKLVNTATEETRALTAEEVEKFEALRSEVADLDKTIELAREQRAVLDGDPEPVTETRSDEVIFDDYIKGRELRANEMKVSANGDIIPQKISDDIVRKLNERSGIFSDAAKVAFPGVYKQVVERDKITAGWVDELAEVTAVKAGWDTVDIGHHKLGALAKISLELINQAQVPVVDEVIGQMVDAFEDKLEEAVISGSGTKQMQGLINGGTVITTKAKTAITADEIVAIRYGIPSKFSKKAVWYMHRSTLTEVRKLKGTDGHYLFSEDLTKEFSGYILGRPVKETEFMDEIGASKNIIVFGDIFQAYKINEHPEMYVQVLREKYIDQGAIGVVGFLFIDGKIINNEAFVIAKMPA